MTGKVISSGAQGAVRLTPGAVTARPSWSVPKPRERILLVLFPPAQGSQRVVYEGPQHSEPENSPVSVVIT